VTAADGLELLNDAPLNIVCFRLAPAGTSEEERDALTRAACRRIQEGGRAFVTPTLWDGKAGIRAAFDHWATGPEDIAVLETAVMEAMGG
jgi:glutamate/tyrosine decarboxylase-like PLP-dependent enzyme